MSVREEIAGMITGNSADPNEARMVFGVGAYCANAAYVVDTIIPTPIHIGEETHTAADMKSAIQATFGDLALSHMSDVGQSQAHAIVGAEEVKQNLSTKVAMDGSPDRSQLSNIDPSQGTSPEKLAQNASPDTPTRT